RDTNRGVYKTTNAGNTWDQVLFLGMGTGVIDMVMHPEDRNVLYAAGWDRIRNYNESTTFGLGAKIYKTEDGGGTWKMMQDGLPTDTLSRIGLSISESDPSTICALFVNKEHDLEGVYRSIDGGQSWSEIPTGDDTGLSSGVLGGFGWYFGKVRIDPTDPELIYILGVDLWKWIADDEEWKRVGPNWWTGEVHADKHDLKFFGPDSMLLATDGGLYLSGDRGDTWSDIENIATTQFYRVAYNPHQPDRFFGGAQDNGTVDGNSLVINDWHTIFGGDGFRLLFHPEDPLTFYVETQRGGFAVTTDGGGTYQSAVTGVEATDNRNWDLPIIMSNHNPDVLYYGTDKVYRSSTGPEVEFKAISPVLTDSIVLLDLTSNLSALSESSLDSQLLFAGTGDGNVWRSRDYGSVWHMVSENLPDRYVTSVHQSEIDLNRVFVTHSGYKAGIDLPHIHVSEDLGEAWSDITGDLPPFAVNDLLVLPNNEDQVLFAGTDAGVYFTSDGGEHWERLGENMPYIPVYDLEYNPVLDRIIAGSYGKSIFTFDITQVGISGNPTVAVVEPANNGIMIYPNPTTDLVRIDPSQSSPVQLVSYKIYNTSGLALSGGAFPGTSVLSVGKWPSGTYLLVLRDKTNRLYQQRIIKW
ncbi:MAG: T9SS type A sorting domain-containing protein, partial [Saprospiraceae bacterium]|nr:T9SS type A sorting domain-containing protein [Saprospiraceae bacterium]